jgi:adenine-specific DNA-methyltransferase
MLNKTKFRLEKKMALLSEDPMTFPIDTAVEGKRIHYNKTFKQGYDVVLAVNDVFRFLKSVPKNSVRLVVTSPHYNMGKTHEQPLEFKQYLKWQKNVIRCCVNVLQDGGSICWESGNYIKDGEIFPLDIFFYKIFKDLGLKLRNRVVWHFEHGLHSRKRFSGRYETILWFTKDDNYIFNLDVVRVPQKYPGKRAYKGPNKGKPSGNPLGKNPSDFWKVVSEDWEREIWDVPNVKFNHPEKTIHPSQYPIELVERLVLALTNEGDVVLDPFVGVGSSIIAAVLHNRQGVGVDKEKIYTDIAHQRIIEALKGTLRRRSLGKPIFKPKGNEKVAKIPPEWQVP